jgi:hypothetical protein
LSSAKTCGAKLPSVEPGHLPGDDLLDTAASPAGLADGISLDSAAAQEAFITLRSNPDATTLGG